MEHATLLKGGEALYGQMFSSASLLPRVVWILRVVVILETFKLLK